jgi:hypothetical protein
MGATIYELTPGGKSGGARYEGDRVVISGENAASLSDIWDDKTETWRTHFRIVSVADARRLLTLQPAKSEGHMRPWGYAPKWLLSALDSAPTVPRTDYRPGKRGPRPGTGGRPKLPPAPPGERIHYTLAAGTREAIERAAGLVGLNRSDVIRHACLELIEREQESLRAQLSPRSTARAETLTDSEL